MNEDIGPVDRARTLVLEWLRVASREPEFLGDVSPGDLPRFHEAIANQFLRWAGASGFGWRVTQIPSAGGTGYQIHWTHHGSSFVGFKQSPPQATREDALLLECAALLDNQWCRQRLPP